MSKVLKLLFTITLLVPVALIATACNNLIEFEIISVEILTWNNGTSETVTEKTVILGDKDELYGVDVGVVINDGENLSRNKVTVTWEIIGDNLGCEILIIDPCCTGGRLAFVKLGNTTGEILVRVTAKSKNELSADIVIKIID
jgi:hypothetical protein